MFPQRLRPLIPYLKRRWRGLLLGTASVLLTQGIAVQYPRVIQRAIDDLSHSVTGHKLVTYALLIVAVFLVKGIFQFLTRWIVIGISRDIDSTCATICSRTCFAWPEFYQRNRTGDMMSRATNDLNAVACCSAPPSCTTANTARIHRIGIVLHDNDQPPADLYRLPPLPIASIVIQYFGRRIHERFERIQAMFSDISARAQENFSGARVIRAYVQEQAEIDAFETANREYIRRSLGLARLMGMLWPTPEPMLGAAIVIVLWMGGRQVIQGRMKLARSSPSIPTWSSSPGPSSPSDGSSISSSAAPPH